MSLGRLNTETSEGRRGSAGYLSPVAYDDDASSLHSRSDQDTDSDDDELQSRARNSRELAAADRRVLMEEDDIDRLVTDSRRRQERRGSGLVVPNPLNLFGRRRGSVSSQLSTNSAEEAINEKREMRRHRRKQKKQKLLGDARDGEDGELMHEMEEGGMKEGSSTGDSSDRDESDEMDRDRLHLLTNSKSQRWRRWRKWLLIHLLIAIGFAMLVLVAYKMSKGRKSTHKTPHVQQGYTSNGTALFAPTTIIISLDGFRADFLQRGLTPRLNAFIKEGVSPKYMLPSFPSVTFPNHYTLATGLYPESHGIVSNTFWDPQLQAEFYYTDPNRSLDPMWWMGEPFWVTAESQGIRTAVHMWPGSEAHIQHVEPSFLDHFKQDEALDKKVARVMEFLDKPGKEKDGADPGDLRPQLIAAYVPNVDSDGHRYGPNSTEIRTTIQDVDDMLDKMFSGLEARNLTSIVNVIVVSDHGMATTDTTRLIQLEDLIDVDKLAHIDGWPLYGLRPKNDDDLPGLYKTLQEKAKDNPNFDVYLRDENMPERYHFSHNERIAPLWILPKTGWAIVLKEEFVVQDALKNGDVYHPRGLHGYDHEHPLMRAIFVARGPAFPHPPNSQVHPFQNTEVYNMLCDSIGMEPKPNNGTLRLPLKPVGLHNDEDKIPEPADPVPSSSSRSSSSKPTVAASKSAPARPTLQTSSTIPPQRPSRPAKPSDVDEPEETAPTGEGDGKQKEKPPAQDHEGDKNKDDKQGGDVWDDAKETVKGWWEWVKDKADGLWKSVSGSS